MWRTLSFGNDNKMNIKQEDFDKLKQLDRIEYLQRYDRIVEQYSISNTWEIIVWSILVMPSVFLSSNLVLHSLTGKINQSLLHLASFSLSFAVVIILSLFMVRVVLLLIAMKKRKELSEKFFNFKTEVKNK